MSPRRVFAALVTTYVFGLLGWLFWPAFRDSFVGGLVGIPPFSPSLTDRSDCSWMWCRPTIFGVLLAIAVWLPITWLVSLVVAGVLRLGLRLDRPSGSAGHRD